MNSILKSKQIFLGCDTTSKVGTKSLALKSATSENIPTLVSFGQASLDEDMKAMAEKFLVGYVSKDKDIDNFDDLRHKTYYKKSTEISIEKLPPTSSSITLHIKRAYLQTYIWLRAPFINNLEIDPLQYGYEVNEDDEDEIVLTVVNHVLPEDFPMPCKCGKCARENVCSCRINDLNAVNAVVVSQTHAKIQPNEILLLKYAF